MPRRHARQGDRMSFVKKSPKTRPNSCFTKKLCVTFFRGPKIFAAPEFFKKPAQRKQSPNTIRKLTQYISENSPNLVALSCVTRVI
jgi:hypothetical protein